MKQRKLSFVLLVLVLVVALSLVLVACGSKDDGKKDEQASKPSDQKPVEPEKPTEPETPSEPSDPTLKDFTGLTMDALTVTYDGNEHSLELLGAPEGAKVVYTNNTKVDAGVYDVIAEVSMEGYNSKKLNAKLTINKATIKGITFEGASVTYDGQSHKIEIAGTMPEGSTLTYSGGEDKNVATNAGSYTIKASIVNKNYNTLELTADLDIAKATMQNIAFDNGSFEFDNAEHKLNITGNTPTGSTVTYSGGEISPNGCMNPGSYEITCVIENKNYKTLTLKAVLEITSKEEPLNMTVFNGQVYFQNPLDQNRLYTVLPDGMLSKVNNDAPKGFVTVGNQMYYLANGLFTSGINVFDGEKTDTLFEVNGEYLTTDGTNLYYAVSSLLNSEKNGIYSLSIADLNSQNVDPIPTKLVSDKTNSLVYANGYIYYSNKSDGGKLYRVDVTTKNANKVYDYKVSDMIVVDNVLYYCKHVKLSAYLESMDISSLGNVLVGEDSSIVKKLTMSKGKYLTKIGDYIYFVNTDMVTSKIAGDGVYKVKADGSSWIADSAGLLFGTQKVIAAEKDNVYALANNGDNLYYYRASNKHLYASDTTQKEFLETDLMEGFVPPVEKNPITTKYLESQLYNNQMYFINMQDNGRLYKHDFDQNIDIRITNQEVSDFVISNDVLYFATVRLLVNFDLYKLDLVSGELQRLSTDKCVNRAIDGDYIYYTNMSGSNALNRMKIDGTEDTELAPDADDWDVTIVDGKVYFVSKNVLNVYDIATKTVSKVNKDIKPNAYIINNGKIYYMNDTLTKNSVSVYDIKTNTITMLVDLGATQDARSFFVYNNDVYFYRNVAAGAEEKGLYKIKSDNTVELVDKLEGHFMAIAQVYDNKLYFVDAWVVKDALPHVDSTGKLCSFDFTTKEVVELN